VLVWRGQKTTIIHCRCVLCNVFRPPQLRAAAGGLGRGHSVPRAAESLQQEWLWPLEGILHRCKHLLHSPRCAYVRKQASWTLCKRRSDCSGCSCLPSTSVGGTRLQGCVLNATTFIKDGPDSRNPHRQFRPAHPGSADRYVKKLPACKRRKEREVCSLPGIDTTSPG